MDPWNCFASEKLSVYADLIGAQGAEDLPRNGAILLQLADIFVACLQQVLQIVRRNAVRNYELLSSATARATSVVAVFSHCRFASSLTMPGSLTASYSLWDTLRLMVSYWSRESWLDFQCGLSAARTTCMMLSLTSSGSVFRAGDESFRVGDESCERDKRTSRGRCGRGCLSCGEPFRFFRGRLSESLESAFDLVGE